VLAAKVRPTNQIASTRSLPLALKLELIGSHYASSPGTIRMVQPASSSREPGELRAIGVHADYRVRCWAFHTGRRLTVA